MPAVATPRNYTDVQPTGTLLGDILRREAPDLYHAASPLKDFQLATRSADFERRKPEARDKARTALKALDQADIDWLLVSALQEGLAPEAGGFARLHATRDILLPHVSVKALGEATELLLSHLNGNEHIGNFAIRSLREVLKKFPAYGEIQLESISVKAALKLANDILEKCGHADLEPSAVPALSRALHLALKHIKLGAGPDCKELQDLAKLAHTELEVVENYNIKKPTGPSFGGGFDDDMDFDRGLGMGSRFERAPRRKPAPKAEKTIREGEPCTLIEKVADDLVALHLGERSRFWAYQEEGKDERHAAWKRWAAQRQARASIYMLVIGEAGAASELPERERYAESLKACVALPNKVLSGCAMSALGTLVTSFEPSAQLQWYSDIREIKSQTRREKREFEAKGTWGKIRDDLDLLLRIAPDDALTVSELVPYLTDVHPKVRKAAFARVDTILAGLSEGQRFDVLSRIGILAEHPFGYDSPISYPHEAAGRMSDLLAREQAQMKSPEQRNAANFAWAHLVGADKGIRSRERRNLPEFPEALQKTVEFAATWNSDLVFRLASFFADRLGGEFSFSITSMNPEFRDELGVALLRLLPAIGKEHREYFVEKMLRRDVPVEDCLKRAPEAERQKIAEATQPALEHLGKHRNALILMDRPDEFERERAGRFRRPRDIFRVSDEEMEKPVVDSQLPILAAKCTLEDLRFLIDRALSEPSAVDIERAQRHRNTDADSLRKKSCVAVSNLLKHAESLDITSFAEEATKLAALAEKPDGKHGDYSFSLSKRREHALDICMAIAARLCRSESNEAAVAAVKSLLTCKEEGVSLEALKRASEFTLVVPENTWNDIGAAVKQTHPGVAYRLDYAIIIALAAKTPETRDYHLSLILDGLEDPDKRREEFPRYLAKLMTSLPADVANPLLDRVVTIVGKPSKKDSDRYSSVRRFQEAIADIPRRA